MTTKEVPEERKKRGKRESEAYPKMLEHIKKSIPAIRKLSKNMRQSKHFSEENASKKRQESKRKE
jgi:hypothetical protein